MAAPVSAARAAGEFLQSSDDLLKLAAFRKKPEKEKSSIDVRLKNGVKEQMDATREGLRKLLSTRSNVQIIKDEMESIDRMCSDPKFNVSTFDQISRVSMAVVQQCTSVLIHPARFQWSTAISSRQRRWSIISSR